MKFKKKIQKQNIQVTKLITHKKILQILIYKKIKNKIKEYNFQNKLLVKKTKNQKIYITKIQIYKIKKKRIKLSNKYQKINIVKNLKYKKLKQIMMFKC